MYETAVRVPGNAKAPGGYVFRTYNEARQYALDNEEARHYEPYEIVLPRSFSRSTTMDYMQAARARHRWHTSEGDQSLRPWCGVCRPRDTALDCHLLTVAAPFVNPDTGEPA